MRNPRLAMMGMVFVLSWPAAAGAEEDEAWFTGSINSTGANGVPPGHFLAEPYLAEVIVRPDGGPSTHTAESINLLLAGVADNLTVGLIPRFAWRDRAEPADLTARLQYRLTTYDPDSGRPILALIWNETLPTGRYDNLDRAGGDGSGTGAYISAPGLALDDYFHLPGDHLMRLRIDLAYAVPTGAHIENRSVYGTQAGFSGHGWAGSQVSAVTAFEVSLTPRWALALDVDYNRGSHGSVDGSGGQHWVSGAWQSANVVPALEYNFTADTGLIVGVQMPVWQRNTSVVVVPVAALNCVF